MVQPTKVFLRFGRRGGLWFGISLIVLFVVMFTHELCEHRAKKDEDESLNQAYKELEEIEG